MGVKRYSQGEKPMPIVGKSTLTKRKDEIMNSDFSKDVSWRMLVKEFQKSNEFIPALHEFWPEHQVVCDQSLVDELRKRHSDVQFVQYDEGVRQLPKGTLDGIHLYLRSFDKAIDDHSNDASVILSAGLIVNEIPVAGIVMASDKGRTVHHTGINGRIGSFVDEGIYPKRRSLAPPLPDSIIGIGTMEGNQKDFIKYAINPLLKGSGAKFEVEVPVASGIMRVARGDFAAYMTYSARPEEVAGSAAICMAHGMWAAHLHGELMYWTCPRLKWLLFARDEETFAFVQNSAKEYIGRHLTDTR